MPTIIAVRTKHYTDRTHSAFTSKCQKKIIGARQGAEGQPLIISFIFECPLRNTHQVNNVSACVR